ncbi:MAG: nucleotide exchange factor GrpE [Rhodospirillales bacterium]|nr:nucleotide exchange factor GrpE [Rhodospirillales bacterium]
MPDQKKPKPEQPEALKGLIGPAPVVAESASPAQASADPPAAAPAATPDAGPPAPSPETQIAALEGQVAELNDKLLRALAEAENVRRRAERDREDAYKYAVANFARDVLGVADNLRRATESIDADVRKADPAVDKVMAGIELTEREMLATFERYGIKPVAALGEKFDHNRHEALFEVEDKARPAGTVVQVLETGYTLHDRLLRPAKVGLAKGGPKVEARADAKPEAAEPGRKASPGAPGAYESKGSEPGGKLDEKL